jgi:alpha-beta hydrolase superfamily lysophospholipase
MSRETLSDDDALRLVMRDGTTLAASRWMPARSPRAVLVVSHGMGEHRRRYRAPLVPFVAAGYAIYAADHRGHGQTATDPSTLGDYGAGGFARVVDDLAAVIEYARGQHPNRPLILLAHSMGSMIAQALVVDHPGIVDALILSGSVAIDALVKVAATRDVLATINATFEPARTPFDWLSRDPAEVDAYIADPLCGFGLTPESFGSLFGQGERLADPALLAHISPELPICIVSGGCDPLVADFAALDPLIERYRAAGLSVQVRLYPGARHELLNEINRDEVVADLIAWCDRVIAEQYAP